MPKSRFFKRKFIVLTLTVGSIILTLGLGTYYLGKFFAEDILNQIIQEETDGLYQLNFETVDVDLFEKQIRVNNLVLSVDSTKDISALEVNNIYEISLEALVIDLESILPFYFEKELVITNVRVVDPDIEMVSLQTGDRTAFSLEAGNMYQAISDYLKVLKIDYFRIQDGELNYNDDRFSLGSIDFKINDLTLDSVTNSNRVFYSENIELEIKNQHFFMPDSIHEITFDRFRLSTRDSILLFENLKIQPRPGSNVDFEGDNEINVYEITVPKLALKGIDYLEAYQKNHLSIQELVLDDAIIFVDDESHARKVAEDKDNSLLTQIFSIFGALDIRKLSINNAHMDIKIDGQKTYQRLKTEESNITFYNIHLDTSNYRFDHRFEYFEDIEIDIRNYTYLLPDSVHSLHFDLLRINSFDSEIILENAEVNHERAGNETKFLMNMAMPSFRLKYIDFKSAIASKVLNAGRLEVPELDIVIRNDGISKKRKLLSVEDFYRGLAPYFREILIDKIDVQDADLTLPKGLRVGKIMLDMRNIHVSAAARRFSDMLGYTRVNASDFELDQDSIHVAGDQIIADEQLSSFALMDWEVKVNRKNQQISGSVDSIQVSGVHFDSLLLSNYRSFKRIFIHKPDILFALRQNKNDSSAFDPGIEKEVIVSNGSVQGTVGENAVFVEDLNTDVFLGDSTAFRKVDITNARVESQSFNHLIEMGNWTYDTLDGRMEFRDLSVLPIDLNATNQPLIIAKIPFLGLRSFEQARFFDQKHVSAKLIRVVRPDIKVSIPDQVKDTTETEAGYSVHVDRFQLDTGYFAMNLSDKVLDSLVVRGVSSSFYGISYPQDDPFADGRLFYSDSVDLSILAVSPYLNSGDEVGMGQVSYQSQGSRLMIDSVRYLAANESVELLVPQIQINELDVEGLYKEQKIQLKEMNVLRPQGMNYAIKDSTPGRPFREVISIDNITLEDINWMYKDTINEKAYAIRQGNLAVGGLYSEDSISVSNMLKHIDRFSFDAKDLDIPLDAPYTVKLGSYQYDYPINTLQVHDLKLVPEYSAKAYSSVIEEQKDWFDVTVNEIKLERLALAKWISGECYQVGALTLDGVDALIYRDKDVPFPEDQVKSLPQETIRQVSDPFHIDTLLFNGSIRYQEKPDDYNTHGEISFDDLNAQLTNVGNYRLGKDAVMKLKAKGKLMEVGSFTVQGAFNMIDENEPFSLRGTVRDFPLDSMNQMLGPVANVNIKSGYTKELTFDFKADDMYANGEMRMRYNDLKVQILNTKTHDQKGLGQGIKTFFANAFVVKNRNPSFLLFLRKGTIFYERDTTRAIFNYWGKALLSGTISSIGVHKADRAQKKFARKEDEELVFENEPTDVPGN